MGCDIKWNFSIVFENHLEIMVGKVFVLLKIEKVRKNNDYCVD